MKYSTRDCIGSRLRRLSRIVDGYYRKHLAEFDITESQMSILFVLELTGKIDQGKIGQILHLERSSVSRNIKLLEKKRLIKRTSEYRPAVELTAKGVKLISKIKPRWEKAMEELSTIIGKDGMKMIEKLEKKLM